MNKFNLGIVVHTPAVVEKVPDSRIYECLKRHSMGDWGDVPLEDWRENDLSLHHNLRLFSVYGIEEGGEEKFWVITEADRSSTTVLMPEDY
jgi:hypothetical protein